MLSIVIEVEHCDTEVTEHRKKMLENVGEFIASLIEGELNKVWTYPDKVEIARDYDW